MVFCKEENREFLQSLKTLVQRDREAGEFVPPNFDSILKSLDEMSAKNDGTFLQPSDADVDVHVSATYSPGRKEYEILQAYNSLIEAGGRPVFPLGDTYHVSKDPERYLEILVPWIGGCPTTSDRGLDWKDIFQQQLLNWQQFRAWQRVQRDDQTDRKQISCSRSGGSSSKLEIHVESTRERLTHCGFTKSFCFHNDAERQDDWTTWIEYLSFECYCLDDCSRHLTAAGMAKLRVAMALNYPVPTAATSSHSLAQDPSRDSESKATSASIPIHQPRVRLRENGAVPWVPVDTSRISDSRGIRCRSNDVSDVTFRMDDSPASDNTSPSRVQCETDVTAVKGRPTKLHDAEHHNLILRWAFLQEPEIAASCSGQHRISSTHGETQTATLASGLQRFKRHRDGSLRGPVTTCIGRSDGGESSMDDLTELDAKRCRSST
ncbi:hypothetical protein E4U42_000893 [Claviceps africana]|uniref:Uncharacterized protein n=1 Tax=Claviceps africana TaxID=83212 RepID=A0A8K0NEK7_9HYPO|nr:hypothetical protein E4U42_000893 [Claviceps africana]